eukprot:5967574-Amphidinium_carterae.3
MAKINAQPTFLHSLSNPKTLKLPETLRSYVADGNKHTRRISGAEALRCSRRQQVGLAVEVMAISPFE